MAKSIESGAFLKMESDKGSKTEVDSDSSVSKVGGPLLFVAFGSDKPKLVTDPTDLTTFDYVVEETQGYSITPTTFKSRTLGAIKEFGDDFTWYVDEFSHGKSSVLRFGINAARVSYKAFKWKISENSGEDTRSGSSQNSSAAIEARSKKIAHTELEKFLIDKALIYLLDLPDRKTVLVDIFARDNEGLLRLEKNGSLEVHTILLYKNPLKDKKHDIVVIDPSNFSYSSHLSNLSGLVKHLLCGQIMTLHKDLQIYKGVKDKIGPNSNQYRDCIDIAVKLGFCFETEKIWNYLEVTQIQNLDIVKSISNVPKINKDIIFDLKDKLVDPSRVKQSSDIEVIKNFYHLERILNKNIARIEMSGFKDTYNFIKNKYISIIKSDSISTKVLLSLYKLCKESIEEHKNELGKDLNEQLAGLTIEDENII